MAMLFKTDGTKMEVQPENGVNFRLKELYKLLDIEMVELIHLGGDYILLCDEEGKLKNSPQFNPGATHVFQLHFGHTDEIYGNAILCLDKEFK